MIDGGWPFIYAAYALTVVLLGGLSVAIALRARHWANEARKLDDKK
ncbi:MAG: heme exporter protein CcmD [Hyphomonadaceae bacterium]